MRVVLQRVTRAHVTVDDRIVGRIDRGFVVLAGFRHDDSIDSVTWIADKILSLRLFPDGTDATSDDSDDPSTEAREKASSFSRDISDVDGSLLVVSQFTLYGDTRKGRRPSFIEAAPPDAAAELYNRFVAVLRERAKGRVETGEFGAMMQVELVNDGPVTLILER
jgi:D-tyrosyl-tRNA(Tyr) deacylase